MDYSKIELARIQLERALELFFDEEDYVSVVTLAGASEDITRKVLERAGESTAVCLSVVFWIFKTGYELRS